MTSTNRSGLIAIFGLSLLLALVRADDWHYPTPAPNGVVNETERWGGQCDTGRRQSPIDLTYQAAVKGEFSPFLFNNYMSPIRNAKLTNTGHSVQIDNDDPTVTMFGGGIPSKFVLDQMHFHWGSEHTINGVRYALELHMVHHDARYKTLAEAAAVKNAVAVLGVLFHVSQQDNTHLDVVLETSNDIRDEAGKSATLKGKLSPHNLLPKNRTSYFRYEGSLTTPTCAESVIWTVFTESLPVSLDQVELFKIIHDQAGHELLNNYRSLQPLNARALVYTTDLGGASGSGAGSVRLGLLTLIGTLLVAAVRRGCAM
ncbi:putative carbonic anhydrase 3 [Toxorhynchites rutilus septentrionalis]|uniref:putative carbonic anhydrase 3 n=1 Tax=Toxorhynchites rutilus septentrionalis TaxID=329112 RepID=UPI00247927A9|nr:putative carbonic anhydrase 3 [Toxorhynchites rutilus septentrionalis]